MQHLIHLCRNKPGVVKLSVAHTGGERGPLRSGEPQYPAGASFVSWTARRRRPGRRPPRSCRRCRCCSWTSNYRGEDALDPREDLAGLNHVEVPAALVECANMRNPDQAALLTTAQGRARYAAAITEGILRWLATSS